MVNSWIIHGNSCLKRKENMNCHELTTKRVRRPQGPKAIYHELLSLFPILIQLAQLIEGDLQ